MQFTPQLITYVIGVDIGVEIKHSFASLPLMKIHLTEHYNKSAIYIRKLKLLSKPCYIIYSRLGRKGET